MSKYVTQLDIIQATLRCAYKTGLPLVTMKAIGKEVGILGQGLYNHFLNKEEIFIACFNYCDSQLSELYDDYRLDPKDDLMEALRKLWFRYFEFFIDHPALNCFYRSFRELANFPYKEERDGSYFESFWNLMAELDEKYHFMETIPRNILLYYIRIVTPYLARSLSDGIMEDTPSTREHMWQLISKGISVLEK